MWRYCIVSNEKVTNEMAKVGNYTSREYMRHSKSGNTLVKWKGKKPKCIYDFPEIENILDELKKPEWQVTDEQ